MPLPIYVDNVLRERWNDATRTYTSYNAAGVQTSTRPYTAAENAAADAEIAAASAETNRRSIETALETALAELQTTIDATNASINSNAAVHIKILARAARRIIRLLIRRYDGTT